MQEALFGSREIERKFVYERLIPPSSGASSMDEYIFIWKGRI